MTDHIRASGVILVQEDGVKKVVLVKHESSLNGIYYLLPGGGLELAESIEECVIREVHEECGLNVIIKKFIFCKDVYSDQDHTLDMIFLCDKIGGELENLDPDKKVKEVCLLSEEELQNVNFIPKQIKSKIFGALENPEFLGKFKYPEKN